jgi:iron complex transport system ATP-binding protein
MWQAQVVEITKALSFNPKVILLDEPTANLDIHHQMDFLDLILTLNREKGLTIVMASHDMNIASEFCDRLILFQKGRIYKMGLEALRKGTTGELKTKLINSLFLWWTI